jgi:hypothetical protein
MAKHQILLIDDELQWTNYFIENFKYDFTIHSASDIQSAIVILENNTDIKAIITDLAIRQHQKTNPVFGGTDIVATIKSKRPYIPIIVYSSIKFNHLFSNVYPGVDLIINREEIVYGKTFINRVNTLILQYQNRHTSTIGNTSTVDAETKKIMAEELEKYAYIKERTLSIPKEGNYELIRPLVGFKRDIEKQLERFDFSRNVFLMMKFRASNKDLSDYIIDNLRSQGFYGIRADSNEWNLTHNIYNPIAVLYCCKYGIALFDEPEDHQAYSPNVAYELGVMHTQNKTCLILRHNSLPQVPFDLIKDLYTTYDKDLQVKTMLANWLIQIRTKI